MTMGGTTQPSSKTPKKGTTLREILVEPVVDFLSSTDKRIGGAGNVTPVLPNSGNFLNMGNVRPETRSPKEVKEVPDMAVEKGFQDMAAGNVPRGIVVEEPAAPAAERDIGSLFEKATGTTFNPKSRIDVARKAELEDFLSGNPDFAGKSDTQVALQWYRKMANEQAKRK